MRLPEPDSQEERAILDAPKGLDGFGGNTTVQIRLVGNVSAFRLVQRRQVRGRLAIHEILVPDDRVHRLITAQADLGAIRNAALAGGMRPMLINGLERAAAGEVSIREVCRVAAHG